MTVVWVRVLELRTQTGHSRMNKLIIYMETRTSTMIHTADLKGGIDLKTGRKWRVSIPSQASECLSLTLKKRRIFGANRIIGQCALPLEWFPTNRVVREWFPMTDGAYQVGSDVPAMVYLDVHVENRDAKPFMAAFSNLRVVPDWPRPDQARDSPAPPQVVYVLPEQTAGQLRYVPVGASQYPTRDVMQQLRGAAQTVASAEQVNPMFLQAPMPSGIYLHMQQPAYQQPYAQPAAGSCYPTVSIVSILDLPPTRT